MSLSTSIQMETKIVLTQLIAKRTFRVGGATSPRMQIMSKPRLRKIEVMDDDTSDHENPKVHSIFDLNQLKMQVQVGVRTTSKNVPHRIGLQPPPFNAIRAFH